MNVNEVNNKYDFELCGPSYIGKPRDNTFMFVAKKVENLLFNLTGIKNCLVFAENGIEVNEEYKKNNCFVFTDTPQLSYTRFAEKYSKSIEEINRNRAYKNINGSLIGENVIIGKCTRIEPGCFIDHDVVIGDDCTILANTTIKNAIIGNNVLINESALIGTNGFNMTTDEYGNKLRMPSLGKVVIQSNVEIGAFDSIARGVGGETRIGEYAKIDAHVHIGHDVIIHKNVEITAGCILGGFVEIFEESYLGLCAVIKNRITIGKRAFIGMGSVVAKSIEDNTMVLGNPARPLPIGGKK